MITHDLFPKPPRKPPRVLMRVIDAGGSCCGAERGDRLWVHLQCKKCGHKEEHTDLTVTKAKRGHPCPKRNAYSGEQVG